MKDKILVDSDVIVQYLKTGKGLLPSVYDKYEMVISASTLAELLASRTFEDSSLEKEVVEFIDKYFVVREVSRDIAMKAAEIIRNNGTNLATAFVAGTSVCLSLPILSENKDYRNIEGVKILEV